jgi:hypothetical protein
MDWRNVSWPAFIALLFVVMMFVTLALSNEFNAVAYAFGFSSVTAAVLSLRQ